MPGRKYAPKKRAPAARRPRVSTRRATYRRRAPGARYGAWYNPMSWGRGSAPVAIPIPTTRQEVEDMRAYAGGVGGALGQAFEEPRSREPTKREMEDMMAYAGEVGGAMSEAFKEETGRKPTKSEMENMMAYAQEVGGALGPAFEEKRTAADKVGRKINVQRNIRDLQTRLSATKSASNTRKVQGSRSKVGALRSVFER